MTNTNPYTFSTDDSNEIHLERILRMKTKGWLTEDEVSYIFATYYFLFEQPYPGPTSCQDCIREAMRNIIDKLT